MKPADRNSASLIPSGGTIGHDIIESGSTCDISSMERCLRGEGPPSCYNVLFLAIFEAIEPSPFVHYGFESAFSRARMMTWREAQTASAICRHCLSPSGDVSRPLLDDWSLTRLCSLFAGRPPTSARFNFLARTPTRSRVLLLAAQAFDALRLSNQAIAAAGPRLSDSLPSSACSLRAC